MSITLGYRTLTDIGTQTAVLNKIRELSYHINPKIWLGCDMLALYTNIRPRDLLNLVEADFDVEYGVVTVRRPTKKKKNRKITVRLIDEHISEVRSLKKRYPGLSQVLFFRHAGGVSGVRADQPFGMKYFYKWWIKACKELGVEGLDLYGGTRHTTTTALARVVGEEGAKRASGHDTNKAFERYCQFQDDEAFRFVKVAAELKGKLVDLKKASEE